MDEPSAVPPPVIDRRRLIQVGGAGAVIGATWLAPSVFSLDQAFAATSACAVAGGINWATGGFTQNQPGKATLTSVSGWNVGTFGSTAVNFQISDPNNRLEYSPTGGFPQYNTGVQPTTTDNSVTGFFSMIMNKAAFNNQATLTMTFSKKIKTLSFKVIDLTIGGGGTTGYIDKLILTAYNGGTGGTKVPIVVTGTNPTITNNSPTANDVTAVATATPNSPATTNTITVAIAGPFDTLVIQYIQGKNVTSANATAQYVGITNMSWTC